MRPAIPYAAAFAAPLDRRVPFADIAAHARVGDVIGVWLAGGGSPPVPQLLIGSAGRGPRRAGLLVAADLGALIARVRTVLVCADGQLCLVASRHLAAARRLQLGDGPDAPSLSLAGRSAEGILVDALADRVPPTASRVRYRFDSPPDALLG